jgi:AcrR family transcriptional regulator
MKSALNHDVKSLWNAPILPTDVGLRERKKAVLRQHISDTATELFLQRGFDAVHIKEIAQVCDVSEKTVYNYFPVKEALLLDREDAMSEGLRRALTNYDTSTVQAMVGLLRDEVEFMTEGLKSHKSPAKAMAMVRQFLHLLETHPSLMMYQQNIMDRLVDTTAGLLSQRNNSPVDAPETRIAAEMLIGLWNLQHRALRNYVISKNTPNSIANSTNRDVAQAAKVIERGLSSIGL